MSVRLVVSPYEQVSHRRPRRRLSRVYDGGTCSSNHKQIWCVNIAGRIWILGPSRVLIFIAPP